MIVIIRYEVITIFSLIFLYFVTNAFNVSNVIELYKAICGNQLCDKSKLHVPELSQNNEFCPRCSCNITCIVDKNCCPDFFFSFNQSCIETSVLNFHTYRNDRKAVTMIANCPENSDPEVKKLCEGAYDLEENLRHAPISSLETGLTYRNSFCAQCHNESDENTRSWNLEIKCHYFADFNFLSSYAEIIELAKTKKCNIFYSNTEILIPDQPCDKSLNKGIINSCNVSGTWETYDPDIEFACNIYNGKYNFFENIFCYMCNPPTGNSKFVSECNTTTWWTPFNGDLEKACLQTLPSLLTTPFKNVYCFLCNRNNIEVNYGMHTFKEMAVTVDQTMQNNETFIFRFKSQSLEYKRIQAHLEPTVLKQTLNNLKFSITERLDENISLKKIGNLETNMVNITNLLINWFAFSGDGAFCQNYSIFTSLSWCDCSEHCFFGSWGCCIDRFFQRSTMCTDPIYSSEQMSYLVYKSCTRNNRPILHRLCSENDDSNLFTFLPTQIKIGNEFVHYKNIYCALCANINHSNPENEYIPVSMWDLEFTCDVYLPPNYHVSFDEYFKFAKGQKCSIKYQPQNNRITCQDQEQRTCNMTRNWLNYDPDVKYACEDIGLPSNGYGFSGKDIFCSICNPENTKIKYTTCNMTGFWQSDSYEIEENCINMPMIQFHAPYKNIFCKKCNYDFYQDFDMKPGQGGGYDSRFTYPPYSKQGDIQPVARSFRQIFALSNYQAVTHRRDALTRCNASQVLVENECRDLKCYPGRFMVESGCVPLFQFTQNLGYILYIGMKSTLLVDINATKVFLFAVKISLYNFLTDYLSVTGINFESTYILTNLHCPLGQHWRNGTDINIATYLKFFIYEKVNRSMIEEKLVSLLTVEFNVSYGELVHLFTFYGDKTAFHLPSLISKLKFTDKCFLKEVYTSIDAQMYIHSHVNDLLLCEQVEINQTEFKVNRATFNLTVTLTGYEIFQDEYILTSNRKARLCWTTLQSLYARGVPQSGFQSIWGVVQLICTCISLLCLLLTFLTYCLFPSLRSLPGTINMCLVVSMFFAHFIFQFVMFGTKFETFCKIIGMLIHYFWLATFGCLSVCSFHMYRVFKSKTGISSSDRSKISIYIIYSYGTPVIIVTLNIVITASVSEGSAIGYGGHMCFLNQSISFFVTFITPIALVCCSNIYFFIVTAVKIATRPKVKSDVNMKTNEIHLTVYIKLFTITGISWLLQIIDTFIPASAFSTIVSLLNALQGVFIFISYVCNKRVFGLYRNAMSSVTVHRNTTVSENRTMTTHFSSKS